MSGTKQIIVRELEGVGRIRMITEDDGEVWFFASDVAKALGHSNTKKAVMDHCEDAKNLNDNRGGQKVIPIIIDEFGNRFNPAMPPIIISESDMYSLIFSSKLAGAKKFTRWVTKEVLPSIRKTGMYIADPDDFTLFPRVLPAYKAAIEVAKLNGYSGNHSVLTANKAMVITHGVDIPKMLGGTNLTSEKQNVLLTATSIGKRFGASAKEVNVILHLGGFMRKMRLEDGKWRWRLTNKGKKFGEYLDVGKSHSDGTPVQQIKWYEDVVEKIKDYFN